MSMSEIKELRMSGRLDEALEMAKANLERDNGAKSHRDLFWVLYDMCKRCLANGQNQEAAELIEQMKDTLSGMDEGQDSVAVKKLEFLENQLSPLNIAIKQADQDSKDEHKVEQAYNAIKDVIKSDVANLDGYQQTTAGWILYRYAKHALEKRDSYHVKEALSHYFKLEVERPSLLHTCILMVAVDLEGEFKKDFKFTAFFEMWGFDQFRDEDWERFVTDAGMKLPSIAEKAIGRYSKELIDDHIGAVPDGFVQLVESARLRFPKDGKIELNYARVLAARGETDQALDVYRNVVQMIPQSYVWQEMSALIIDREIKQAILCKVITMQRDEQFLGDTRLQLAQYLIEDGNLAAAKFELDTYHRAKQEMRWPLKPLYHALDCRIPVGTAASTDNHDLYAGKLERLMSFMYPDAPVTVMFYNGTTFINKKGRKMAKLVAPDGTSMSIASGRLPHHPTRQPHYFYMVKYINGERGMQPLEIKPLESREGMKSYQVIEGDVDIRTKNDGSRFGFVDRCYVHSSLLGTLTNGQHVQVVAVKDAEGRFRAIAVL